MPGAALCQVAAALAALGAAGCVARTAVRAVYIRTRLGRRDFGFIGNQLFFGSLFELLGQFDKPFNQMPSLHIALMVLLWVVYLRALPRTWHWLVHGAFTLIGISVLTTWQHHFIDVPTGRGTGVGAMLPPRLRASRAIQRG